GPRRESHGRLWYQVLQQPWARAFTGAGRSLGALLSAEGRKDTKGAERSKEPERAARWMRMRCSRSGVLEVPAPTRMKYEWNQSVPPSTSGPVRRVATQARCDGTGAIGSSTPAAATTIRSPRLHSRHPWLAPA